MAVVIVITRSDCPNNIVEVAVDRKLILGNSMYCDVFLEDKSVAGMQCEIWPVKSGHIVAKNLDLKKEVHLNQLRLKRSAIRADDVLKIGPFVLKIDSTKLTEEELSALNTEFEEYI